MTDVYVHLDYEAYKRFEAACKEFPERKHSGGSDYYHASIRLPLGKGLTLEVNGPAVKVPPTGPTEMREKYVEATWEGAGMIEEPPPETWDDALARVMNRVYRVLADRQTKYGYDNINAYGELGLKVRLGDKLARLRNSDVDHPDESVDDTWTDVVGYSAIALMVRLGWWNLPREEERSWGS